MTLQPQPQPQTLPNDVARCRGVGIAEDGWREGCADCLRRTSPAVGERIPHMEPPATIALFCEFVIKPA